jgi:hypothetical protein
LQLKNKMLALWHQFKTKYLKQIYKIRIKEKWQLTKKKAEAKRK